MRKVRGAEGRKAERQVPPTQVPHGCRAACPDEDVRAAGLS